MKSTGYVIYSLAPTQMFFLFATILFTIGAAVVVIVESYKKEYSFTILSLQTSFYGRPCFLLRFHMRTFLTFYELELNDHFIITTLLCLGYITVVTLVIMNFCLGVDMVLFPPLSTLLKVVLEKWRTSYDGQFLLYGTCFGHCL